MTRERAAEICQYIKFMVKNEDYTEEIEEALDVAIEALEQIESGRYIKGECSICSKEFGTLGCCTTVSNHWVYSCKEGMAQYAEALEQEPSCRKNRQVDLISRANLQELFNETTTSLMDKIEQKDIEHLVRACVMVTEMIQDAPSIVPKRGHWTDEAGKPNDEQYSLYCSECKAWSEYRDRYCPNCGTRMESDTE